MNRLALTIFLALGLAVEARAAPPKTPPDTSPERIAELIEKLQGGSMSERVRAKGAYEQLLRIGPAAVPQLVAAVRSRKPWVRVWAGAALAATRDPRAIEPMLELLEDPFLDARKIATWHAAGLHRLDDRIAPAIVRRLADDDATVRNWAQRALRERIKFRGIVPELKKMTHSDSAPGRTLAFKLLMTHQKQDPKAAIAGALSEAKDWRVRSAAVRCLGEGVMKPRPPMFELLFHAMDDTSEEVRADAVELTEYVLKETADHMPNEIRAPITNRLQEKLPSLLDASLPRLRGASLYLLAAGDKKHTLFERALSGADHPAPVMRVYALRALGRCGVKNWSVVEKAVARLEDEDPEVRRAAIALLRWATGARFDFTPGDPPDRRAEACRRIKVRIEKARPR